MNIENPLKNAPFEALPKAFQSETLADGMNISPNVRNLVQSQVRALVDSSPNFHNLSAEQKNRIYRDLVKINAYTAALVQEDWAISKKLGQTPVLREQTVIRPLSQPFIEESHTDNSPVSEELADKITRSSKTWTQNSDSAEKKQASSEEFDPRAASQVAKITRETLNAIAFPTFVADLIKGTFQAIVNASIQQMEAYGNLLSNVAKTVDQFMSDNITDNQARDYLTSRYPAHFKTEIGDNAARVRARETDAPPPDFKTDLGLNENVGIDDDSAEEVLVPAARRKLAQSRHSMLSTMVLMGINRIVVTNGRIKASMVFHIDAKDHGQADNASKFDIANETKGKIGYGGGLASWLGGPSGELETKNSISYVSTASKHSDDELNVKADLNGEVEIKFKSDYFPMEKFANPQLMSMIQGNTVNPAANAPNTNTKIGENSGDKAPAKV
jgi:hypothetical protein